MARASLAPPPPGSFRAGETALLRRSRASNFSGRRPQQISRHHRILVPIRAPGDNVQLPCAGRTDSDPPGFSRGLCSPVFELSDCVKDAAQTPIASIENRQHGWRNVAHAGGFVLPPSTVRLNNVLAVQVHIALHEANITAFPSEIFARRTCNLSESPLHPGHTRRNLGGHSEGCTQEEDITFEKEA